MQHSSSHLVKRKSKLKKKSFSIEYDRHVSHSSSSFFSSSYTRMMRDQIESHERMRESVCDTYRSNPTSSTSCSSSKPPQSPLHRRLRSHLLFHKRKQKKSKKMNVSMKKGQRITSKQHTQNTNYISKQITTNQRYS